MPNVHFQLEDPTMCAGCPFNNSDVRTCRAGFKREYAKLIPNTKSREAIYGRSMIMHLYGLPHGDDSDDSDGFRWSILRPQACVMTTDPTIAVKGSLVSGMGANKKPEPAKDTNRHPATKAPCRCGSRRAFGRCCGRTR